MDRIPSSTYVLGAILFAGLAIWAATDENWAGVIAGAVLGAACLMSALRSSRGR